MNGLDQHLEPPPDDDTADPDQRCADCGDAISERNVCGWCHDQHLLEAEMERRREWDEEQAERWYLRD